MSETELPGELNKLNITPVDPQGKMGKSENPFWGELKKTKAQMQEILDHSKKTVDIFDLYLGDPDIVAAKLSNSLTLDSIENNQPLRQRRNSESVLEDFRSANLRKTEPTRMLGLQKNSVACIKKSSTQLSSHKRKITLREPILRALQSCLPAENNARRKTLSPLVNVSGDGSLSVDGAFKPFGNFTQNNIKSETATGISDFKDLINECQELLEHSVDFSTRLNEGHRSKNFTTLRNSINSYLKTDNPANIADSTNSISTPFWHNSIFAADQNHVTTIATTTRANNSSTCSQQAGNGVGSNDDVTINELAGYFENIVHIPKKMSSMAEMMYT